MVVIAALANSEYQIGQSKLCSRYCPPYTCFLFTSLNLLSMRCFMLLIAHKKTSEALGVACFILPLPILISWSSLIALTLPLSRGLRSCYGCTNWIALHLFHPRSNLLSQPVCLLFVTGLFLALASSGLLTAAVPLWINGTPAVLWSSHFPNVACMPLRGSQLACSLQHPHRCYIVCDFNIPGVRSWPQLRSEPSSASTYCCGVLSDIRPTTAFSSAMLLG